MKTEPHRAMRMGIITFYLAEEDSRSEEIACRERVAIWLGGSEWVSVKKCVWSRLTSVQGL